MSTHARKPSAVGRESSLSSLSDSDSETTSQSRVPPAPPAPPAQPVHNRNPSVISDIGSESSLSSLTSSGSERLGQVPRPRTPNTRNAGDVPGLTLSPCTDVSSPDSVRSYGFSSLETYSALGNVVKDILDSKAPENKVEKLYARAQQYLTIFDDPAYSSFDTPEWVQRVSAHSDSQPIIHEFTVRNLIKTMCDTADELQLEKGKRYVVAAVCACAIKAKDAQEREIDLAQRLQGLASTWAAFLLWPFFAKQHNPILPVEEVSTCATPTRMHTATLIDQGLNEHRQGTLRDEVHRRDGHRCVLSGIYCATKYNNEKKAGTLPVPPPPRAEKLQVCHIFKRSVAVYSSNSDKASDKEKYRSAAVTFELLRHYCQLDLKYLEDADLMDKPINALLLAPHFHSTFDDFLWCLKPVGPQKPNCYDVKEYDPVLTCMHTYEVPSQITFKDHTNEDARKELEAPQDGPFEPSAPRNLRKRPHDAVSVNLPDPELLRLHAALMGVLRMSGAAGVFQTILDRRGPNDPPVPSAHGESFIKEVVNVEALDLRDSVADLVHTISLSQLT